MPNDQNSNQAPPENKGVNPINRHHARRYALQAMYQWQLANTPTQDIETEFLKYHIDKKLDLDYFKELIHEIPKNQQAIDDELKQFITRPLSDIDPIELAVLRIAVYEMMQRPDVPYRVIINEALELTKKFGSVEGHRFVNGVLDKVAKKHRTIEMNMEKSKQDHDRI